LEQKGKGRGVCWAGGVKVWAVGPVCLRGERKREKASRPGTSWAGLEEKGEREREGRVCFLFFSNLFQIHFSNIHTQIKQKKSMHSNHDAQALIFSKLF
jgi:hypothetical protein